MSQLTHCSHGFDWYPPKLPTLTRCSQPPLPPPALSLQPAAFTQVCILVITLPFQPPASLTHPPTFYHRARQRTHAHEGSPHPFTPAPLSGHPHHPTNVSCLCGRLGAVRPFCARLHISLFDCPLDVGRVTCGDLVAWLIHVWGIILSGIGHRRTFLSRSRLSASPSCKMVSVLMLPLPCRVFSWFLGSFVGPGSRPLPLAPCPPYSLPSSRPPSFLVFTLT